MSDLVQDLRHGARAFARSPGFSAVAIVTLALGVGATTGAFSIVDGVLLRPLPYPHAERLIFVGTYFSGSDELSVVSEGNVVDLEQGAMTIESLAAVTPVSFTVLGDGDPELIDGAEVSVDFFTLLGGVPSIGRGFVAEDFAPDAPGAVILEHGFWQRRWAGDPDVLGEVLTLNGVPYTVVGVAPADFVAPEAAFSPGGVRLWVPMRIASPPERTGFGSHAFARLAPGATVAAAAEEIDRIFRAQTELHDLGFEVGGGAVSLRERTLGSAAEPLLLLLLGVGFLLLIACANVANLMLGRGMQRDRELAVRRSLGAGRRRLVRQLLTESVALALAGGLVGALLSYGAVQAFKAASPGGIPRLAEIGVDLRALFASLLVSTVVGLLFGLAPAVQAFRRDTSAALRSGVAGSAADARGGRIRALLVVAETGLAVVLLVGAALLMNSFLRLVTVDLGFDAENLIGMRVDLRSAYPDRDTWLPLFRDLLAEARTIPGIESASLATSFPFGGIGIVLQVMPVDAVGGGDGPEYVASNYISRGHFRHMGMRLMEGSDFAPAGSDAAPQVIVNDAFARTYWPGADSVVGKRIRMGEDADDPVATVIGRVNSLRYRHDREPAEMYFDMEANPWAAMWLVARAAGEPSARIRPLQEALWRLDPDLPIETIGTVDDLAWRSVGQPRFYSALAVTLAALALALALVGVYGTMSYSVGRRVGEIGVRMALGAGPGTVVRSILRAGLTLALAGVVLGIGAGWALARLLERFLFGIEPTDPPTFVVAATVFLVTALLACWIPARRAARLDPVAALRADGR